MKLLLDTCVWGKAKDELQAAGIDVVWIGDLEEDPGDEEILAQARAEGRVLVTLDKDFGELAVAKAQSHCGIVRLVSIPAQRQAAACQIVVANYGPELSRGAILTLEPGRIRIRSPENETKAP